MMHPPIHGRGAAQRARHVKRSANSRTVSRWNCNNSNCHNNAKNKQTKPPNTHTHKAPQLRIHNPKHTHTNTIIQNTNTWKNKQTRRLLHNCCCGGHECHAGRRARSSVRIPTSAYRSPWQPWQALTDAHPITSTGGRGWARRPESNSQTILWSFFLSSDLFLQLNISTIFCD